VHLPPSIVKSLESFVPLLWRDIVVIIDDGRRSAPAYDALTRLAAALTQEHPRGYGVLIVIPRNARPPSDQARRAINEALAAAAGGLKCVCWLVEGKGFQAAMARAVLTGLTLFRPAFETHVTPHRHDALDWILSCLRGPRVDLESEIDAALVFLAKHHS
jgi:hypothetical protein